MAEKYPRILLEGPTMQARTRWRVVVHQQKDGNGIPIEVRYVELAQEDDKDAMGVQRWRQVKSGREGSMTDWVIVAQAALDLILEKV